MAMPAEEVSAVTVTFLFGIYVLATATMSFSASDVLEVTGILIEDVYKRQNYISAQLASDSACIPVDIAAVRADDELIIPERGLI